jgi:hypothetical protein
VQAMEFARWLFVGLMTPTETQGTMTNANVRTKFEAFESEAFTFLVCSSVAKRVPRTLKHRQQIQAISGRDPQRTLARFSLGRARHDTGHRWNARKVPFANTSSSQR